MSSPGSQVIAFIDAINQRAATRILEMGTEDTAFIAEVISKANWAPVVELHCTDSPDKDFDADVLAAGEGTDIEFQLTKHSGSELEVNDSILSLASALALDAVFISSASSGEALLTSLLVSHESVKAGGVLGLSSNLLSDAEMLNAISSFRGMLGDAYNEISDHIFVKI